MTRVVCSFDTKANKLFLMHSYAPFARDIRGALQVVLSCRAASGD